MCFPRRPEMIEIGHHLWNRDEEVCLTGADVVETTKKVETYDDVSQTTRAKGAILGKDAKMKFACNGGI